MHRSEPRVIPDRGVPAVIASLWSPVNASRLVRVELSVTQTGHVCRTDLVLAEVAALAGTLAELVEVAR